MGRQQQLLDYFEAAGGASYQRLAKLFGVSTMTIRRDVDRLVKQGAVIKTLGGVQRVATSSQSLHEAALLSRLARQRREKGAIARRTLNLLDAGQTVFIDGGTTCLELARLVAREKTGLTVVTNSILVCRDAGQNGENVVIGLGGQYDPASLSFVGSACEETAAGYFPDIAVFSTKGFMPADGTYESSVPTLRIKQIVARQSRRVLLLVDHTKFGERALRKVLDISQIHDVVTDDAAPAAALAGLRRRGKRVWIAASGSKESGSSRRGPGGDARRSRAAEQ
jgi:DeoR/GlpR family transcriptional regulator of sugar metabolism